MAIDFSRLKELKEYCKDTGAFITPESAIELIEALEQAKEIIKNFPHESDCSLNFRSRCKCTVANEGKEWLSKFKE